jgi:hypothetical protein
MHHLISYFQGIVLGLIRVRGELIRLPAVTARVHKIFSSASPVLHRGAAPLSLPWPLVTESVLQPIDPGPVVTIGGLEIRPAERSVDVFVRKVRRKLATVSPGWTYIHTHFGIGYRFSPERAV